MGEYGIPKAVAVERAEAWAMMGYDVYFKFRCWKCGQVICLQEANTLYENGECCFCGANTPLEKVGFLAVKVLEKG